MTTDPRFYSRNGPLSLGYLTRHVGGQLPNLADSEIMIQNVESLESAEEGDLSLFCDKRYLDAFEKSRASVVITSHELAKRHPSRNRVLLVSLPRLAYVQIGHLFYPPVALEPGINPTAQLDPSAAIGAGSQIDAGVVVGPNVVIGMRCHIGCNSVLGRGVVIGDDCLIGASTVISHALIGSNVHIGVGVSIGSEGFGFVPNSTGLVRGLRLGRVIIEDDVDIGANSAIDRGTLGDTVIGAGTAIDNLVQIGHNVRIGAGCALAGQVGIAGSTVIGDGVMIGGQTAVSDHLFIGAHARIAGRSGVMRNVAPGESVGGYPAMPARQWHRQTVGMMRLFNRHNNGAN
jgi:UDP-3-O-[3-hydroxymyristoyl] glucosamine N-acyltransferase